MAVFDILPSTNISTNDIRDTLSAGGGSVNNHASSWFKPEAKINQYAYFKPIRSETEVKSTITDKDYYDSLAVTKYMIGNPIPQNFVYSYNSPYPSYPLRLGDFRGYMKNEYPELCDLSKIPDIWNFDTQNERISIAAGNSNKWLMDILVTKAYETGESRYFNHILIIATKGNDKRYFLLTGLFKSEMSFIANIPATPEVISYFRTIGIEDYICDAIGVIVPLGHPLYNVPFKILTTLDNIPEFIVHPEVTSAGKIYSPIKRGFKITNPANRAFWSFKFSDAGNGRDMYIPLDAIYGARLFVNSSLGSSDNLNLVGLTGEFDRWTDLGGDFIRESKYTSISGEFSLEYYNFGTASSPQIVKPTVVPSPFVTVIDTGVDIRVEWNNIPISDFNSFEIKAHYLDPNYRPENT